MSVVSKTWQETHLPGARIRSIAELLGEDKELNLQAMNGTDIPYVGWIDVKFKLSSMESDESEGIRVPMLVGQSEQEHPIIGFNVIEEVLKEHDQTPRLVIHEKMQQAFPSLDKAKVKPLVNFIQTRKQEADAETARVGKHDVTIPKGGTTKVMCRTNLRVVREDTPVMFEPKEEPVIPEGLEVHEELSRISPFRDHVTITVSNHTNRDITFRGKRNLVSST